MPPRVEIRSPVHTNATRKPVQCDLPPRQPVAPGDRAIVPSRAPAVATHSAPARRKSSGAHGARGGPIATGTAAARDLSSWCCVAAAQACDTAALITPDAYSTELDGESEALCSSSTSSPQQPG